MDDNKVALIASVIGFVGGLLGAGIGGWAAVRGARQQASAALEQTQRAEAQDQRRWVRDRQYEACTSLHVALEGALQEALVFQSQLHRMDNSLLESFRVAAREQIRRLSSARTAVMLACPPDVSLTASDAMQAGTAMLHSAASRDEEEVDRATEYFTAAIGVYTSSVRALLGLDETP